FGRCVGIAVWLTKGDLQLARPSRRRRRWPGPTLQPSSPRPSWFPGFQRAAARETRGVWPTLSHDLLRVVQVDPILYPTGNHPRQELAPAKTQPLHLLPERWPVHQAENLLELRGHRQGARRHVVEQEQVLDQTNQPLGCVLGLLLLEYLQ